MVGLGVAQRPPQAAKTPGYFLEPLKKKRRQNTSQKNYPNCDFMSRATLRCKMTPLGGRVIIVQEKNSASCKDPPETQDSFCGLPAECTVTNSCNQSFQMEKTRQSGLKSHVHIYFYWKNN